MTRHGIEPRSPGPLANALPIRANGPVFSHSLGDYGVGTLSSVLVNIFVFIEYKMIVIKVRGFDGFI